MATHATQMSSENQLRQRLWNITASLNHPIIHLLERSCFALNESVPDGSSFAMSTPSFLGVHAQMCSVSIPWQDQGNFAKNWLYFNREELKPKPFRTRHCYM